MRLQLLNRLDCHLCDDLATELSRLRLEFEAVDIDRDPALRELYNEAVPVLLLDGEEIARAPVSPTALRSALQRAGVSFKG